MANSEGGATDHSRMISENVKRLRREKHLTLKALSKLASVSHGLMSNLEAGKANPSLSTIVKLAHALEVQPSVLFSGPTGAAQADRSHPESNLVTEREQKILMFHNSDLQYRILTPNLQRKLQVVRTTLPPGFDGSDAPFVHQGEEVVHVISGVVDVYIADSKSVLREGDTISFNPEREHWYRNPSSEHTQLISVATPPSL